MATKLYVGNLAYSATDETVRELFTPYGTVHSVKVIIDRMTGISRGFGFVEMDNAEAAIAALNNKDIKNRTLRVCEAREREGSKTEGAQKRPFGNRGAGVRTFTKTSF